MGIGVYPKTLPFLSGIFLSVLAAMAGLAGIAASDERRLASRRRGVAHIVAILLIIIVILVILIVLTI